MLLILRRQRQLREDHLHVVGRERLDLPQQHRHHQERARRPRRAHAFFPKNAPKTH